MAKPIKIAISFTGSLEDDTLLVHATFYEFVLPGVWSQVSTLNDIETGSMEANMEAELDSLAPGNITPP